MTDLKVITHKAYLVHEELQNMDFDKRDMNQFTAILNKIINE